MDRLPSDFAPSAHRHQAERNTALLPSWQRRRRLCSSLLLVVPTRKGGRAATEQKNDHVHLSLTFAAKRDTLLIAVSSCWSWLWSRPSATFLRLSRGPGRAGGSGERSERLRSSGFQGRPTGAGLLSAEEGPRRLAQSRCFPARSRGETGSSGLRIGTATFRDTTAIVLARRSRTQG